MLLHFAKWLLECIKNGVKISKTIFLKKKNTTKTSSSSLLSGHTYVDVSTTGSYPSEGESKWYITW